MKNILTVIISCLFFCTSLQAQQPAQPFIKLGPLESSDFVNYGQAIACSTKASGADILIGATAISSNPSFVSGQDFVNGELFNVSQSGNFGRAIAVLGDINSDSIADFVVSSPDFTTMYLYISSSASAFNVINISGSAAGSNGSAGFGQSLSASQTYSSIAASSPNYPGSGAADGMISFFDKSSGTHLYNCFGPTTQGERFGIATSWISDLDGDSIPDLIVGSSNAVSGSAVGKVEVISGGSGANCTKISYLTRNSGSADNFGEAVAAVGDVNGDGKEDFVAGGADEDSSLNKNGVAILISGADGSILCDIRGNNDEYLGSSIAGMGDVDSDNKVDFAVGAPNIGSGRVYVFNLDTSNGACSIRYTIDGASPYTEFGSGLSSSQYSTQKCDIDSDKLSELIVSSKGSSFGTTRGAVFAYSFPTVIPTATSTPTATPTSTPTVTATAIPPTVIATATPTLKPQKTPTALAQLPKRSKFNFRITQDGGLIATNVIDSKAASLKTTVDLSSCRVSLIARSSTSDLNSVTTTTQIANSKKSKITTRFNARRLSKVMKEDATKKPYILHVRAKNVCGSKVFYSNVASRYLNCGLEPEIPVDQYVTDLIKKIR